MWLLLWVRIVGMQTGSMLGTFPLADLAYVHVVEVLSWLMLDRVVLIMQLPGSGSHLHQTSQ